MESEYRAEMEDLRLKSVEFWRGRVQELASENRDLREENNRLREQRDFFAFEAITNQMDDTDWGDK